MSRKRAKKEAVKQIDGTSIKIDSVIELDTDGNEQNYSIVRGVTMQQYNGISVQTDGILDSTGTILAVAVARPGRTNYSSSGNNGMSRTLMWGDVAVYSFNKAEKKIGMCIMPTKSWMIMQSKMGDVEKPPFIRTPWDVRQTTSGNTGNLQPPTLFRDIKSLCDVAINYAASECDKKIEENEPSRIQESYAPALASATRMAAALADRRETSPARRVSQNSTESISSQAAALLTE